MNNSNCNCFYSPDKQEKTLEIVWQRLLVDGNTCPRCSYTEIELEKAVSVLKEAFLPLKIRVILKKKEISFSEFSKDSLMSNIILINNKKLEDYINAKTGKSQCCDVCGPNECRTINVEGKILESIPVELIIKAALLAASELF